MSTVSRKELLNIQEKSIGQNFSFIPNEDGEYLPIGEGGTGIVYVAKQYFGSNPDIFSKRAVKFFVFRDDLISTWGYVPKENFIIEIKNISRFNHQNILKVIDGNYYIVNIDSEHTISIPYTVTEFIEGPNLEELFNGMNSSLIQQIFKDEESIFELFSQILLGIEYLHNNNFFHCDIAPKNIFIKSDDDGGFLAVIGDLGAGKTMISGAFDTTSVIGTWDYMTADAQQHKNKEVSYDIFKSLQPTWDIYSTKTTLKEIITKIKECGLFSFDFWNLDRLFERLDEKEYKTINEILQDVHRLKPSSNQILRLDELSEASKNIGQVLLPINSVFLSHRMKKLSRHEMLLRLIDVPQLSEGAITFPGANHTRYEHSLGTYELMRKAMLALLRNKEYTKLLSERYVIIGLLSSLLSNITSFPYYYAIQELHVQEPELFEEVSHRNLFRLLMNKKSDITDKSLLDCINELFGEYKIEIRELEYVIFGKEKSADSNPGLDVLFNILNSPVGVRIIDYIMRDSLHIGLTYKVDTNDLFKSMWIHKGEFCLRQSGVPLAEQIITNRYWLFKRIYWSDPNRANVALLKHIFFLCHTKSFIGELLLSFMKATKNDIQRVILQKVDKDYYSTVNDSINFLNQKGQTRYKRILVLDKNSDKSHSYEICQKFAALNYSKQHEIRDVLEESLLSEYKISNITTNHGAVLLIDIPYEKFVSTLGEGLSILRHDNSKMSLAKASGIVSGMKTTFEDQLLLLRVFIRPDIFKSLINEYDENDSNRQINHRIALHPSNVRKYNQKRSVRL